MCRSPYNNVDSIFYLKLGEADAILGNVSGGEVAFDLTGASATIPQGLTVSIYDEVANGVMLVRFLQNGQIVTAEAWLGGSSVNFVNDTVYASGVFVV